MVRRVPRRALLAATLGALYGVLILPAPGTLLGVALPGVSWFILAASLLFLHPLAYHTYSFWGLVWIVWRGVGYARAPSGPLWALALDLALPVASVALLITSRYLAAARAYRKA